MQWRPLSSVEDTSFSARGDSDSLAGKPPNVELLKVDCYAMASAATCRATLAQTPCFCSGDVCAGTSKMAAQPAVNGVFASSFLPRLPASLRRSGLSSSGYAVPSKRWQKHCQRVSNVRAGLKKKGASKLVASAKKGGAKGTAVLEVEKEAAVPQLEKAEIAEEDDLGDGFENEEEAKAFAAQFADFYEEGDDDSEEEDNEKEADGNEYEEEEDGPVEIDWEYGSDLGSKLGEVFDPIDLGIGKEWPKPWAEVPETYNWSTRTAARREESAKLHRIDMSYVNADVSAVALLFLGFQVLVPGARYPCYSVEVP